MFGVFTQSLVSGNLLPIIEARSLYYINVARSRLLSAARPMRAPLPTLKLRGPLLPSFQRWTDIKTRANGGVQFSLVRQNYYEVRSTWCIIFLTGISRSVSSLLPGGRELPP